MLNHSSLQDVHDTANVANKRVMRRELARFVTCGRPARNRRAYYHLLPYVSKS